MPLPFLKMKPQTGVATEIRPSDYQDEPKEDNGLEACAQDMINAFNSNDAKGLAAAIKAAFEICDTYPHEEGEHTNEMEGQE